MIWSTSSNYCDSCMSGWSGWVFKLEDTQSRTHSPHRILFELKSHRPCPTLMVSLHRWLPNLHKLGHSAIQFLLDAQTMTPNCLEDTQSSKVTSVGSTQEQSLQWCLITLVCRCLVWGFGFFLTWWFSLEVLGGWDALNDKCQFLMEQPTS